MRPLILAVLACVAIASPAWAEETAYDLAIRDAIKEFNAGSWSEARILFRRAHELQPSARTWRGLGVSAYELKLYVDAIAELEAALVDPRRPLTEEQRAEVANTLEKARRFAAVYRLQVPEGVQSVVVNGEVRPIPENRELYLNPGSHTVAIRLPGHGEADQKRVDAAPGARDELVFTLSFAHPPDESAGAGPTAASGRDGSPDASEERGRLWTWVAAGAAGAFAVSGIAFGLATNAAFEEVDSFAAACSPACDRGAIEARQEDGKTYQTLTNVSFALAGVAAVGAVTLFFIEGGGEERPAVAIGPGHVSLRGAF